MLATSQDKEKFEDYDGFVEKFKPKKTTDDCYTPEYIYDVIADYVEEKYGINKKRFVRPFWPGADYQAYEYPPDCVVVDNPPFSILSKILQYYQEREIPFFLFAPALTLFSPSSSSSSSCIALNFPIIYENGANVSTSFITSLEPEVRFRSDGVLYQKLKDAQTEYMKTLKAELPKYSYPDNVCTAPMVGYFSKYGVNYSVKKSESQRIRQLDSQKQYKKALFGGGYLISEKAAAEKAAAEKAAAEKANAIIWELSDREKTIIKSLS